MKRKVCIITGTRADWGLLSPIAKALNNRAGIELQTVVTNMHLMSKYGLTVNDIEADGIKINARVHMDAAGESEADTARAMARCITGMANAFEQLKPDITVILGDRYEMLATASAAAIMRIPIAHLHGGEISEGAIDDSIRHAITKLASLHLTSTEEHRRRVIQMGESPDMVINTGAIGVYNVLHEPETTLDELEQRIGVPLNRNTLLVTYHPATRDDADVKMRFGALLDALDRFPMLNIIFTYPNNDSHGAGIIAMLESYTASRKGRTIAVPSLGKRNYLSALRHIGAVVGNSSSGIIEVPSMHIPSVNVGIRQQGRTAAESVIHCNDDTDSIACAIAYALSDEGRLKAATAKNPYESANTLQLITDAIALTPIEQLRNKKFHDIAPS